MRIYIDGKPAEVEVVRDGLYKDITYGGGEPDLAIGYRFRDNGFKGGRVDDFRVFDRALTPLEAAQLAGRADLADAWNADAEALSADRRRRCSTTSSPARRRRRAQLADELHALRRRAERARSSRSPRSMVMEETAQAQAGVRPEARGVRRARRAGHGRHARRSCRRSRRTQPRNRLGLARWLTRPGEPADRPRDGQPALAADVRPGDRRDQRQLRQPGLAADAPRTARLAGLRLRRPRLGREARCSSRSRLSATYRQSSQGVARAARRATRDNQSARPRPGPAADGRDAPRPGAVRRRAARRKARRPQRQAVPAGRAVGGGDGPAAATTRATATTCTAGASTRSGSGRSRRRR